MAKLSDIISGQIIFNGRLSVMREIKYNGNVIWPLGTTYKVDESTIKVVYSSGQKIFANATNYAYLTATILVYEKNVLTGTIPNQQLSIDEIDATSYFEIRNNCVYAKHLDNNNNGMGVQEYPYGTSCDITKYSYQNIFTGTAPKTVYQQENVVVNTVSSDEYTDYRLELSETDLLNTGGTVRYTCYAVYKVLAEKTFTSGSKRTDTVSTGNERYQKPEKIWISPDNDVIINEEEMTISFPENTTDTEQTYFVFVYWNDFADIVTLTVTTTELPSVYEKPVVTLIYEDINDELGNLYHIGAEGGTVYPRIEFSQKVTTGKGDSYIITGVLENGTRSGYDSDGNYFSISYVGGSGMNNGTVDWGAFGTAYVKAESRGTTEGAVWNIAQGVYVRITANGMEGESNSVTLTQQANKKTTLPASSEYTAVNITAFRLGGNTIASIATPKKTDLTCDVAANGNDTSEKYLYTSGAESGGTVTAFTGRSVTPDMLLLNNVNQGSTNAFSISNVHNEATVSWKLIAVLNNLSSPERTITQAADEKRTAEDEFVCGFFTKVSDTISASGGSANFSANASHVTWQYWLSGGETDIAEARKTIIDSVGLVLESGGGSRFSINDMTVNHTSMLKDETTDSATYYAINKTNGQRSTNSISVSATNRKSELKNIVWEDIGNKVLSNSEPRDNEDEVVSLSASRFTSQTSGAPYHGGTFAILTYSASYTKVVYNTYKQQQLGKGIYEWTSGSTEDGTTERTATFEETEKTRNQIGVPTLTSNQSWLVVTQSSENVTFNPSTNPSDRNAVITASFGKAEQKTVTLYQNRYAEIRIIPDEAVIFDSEGGTNVIQIAYINTTFTISTAGTSTENPVKSITPVSGGSMSGSGTVDVSITATNNTNKDNIFGTIIVTPANTELADSIDSGYLQIDVLQEGTLADGAVFGTANCFWVSASSIHYNVEIRNEGRENVTVKPTLFIYSADEFQHPSEGTMITFRELEERAVKADSKETFTGTLSVIKNINKIYFARVTADNIISDWEQIEEDEPSENL